MSYLYILLRLIKLPMSEMLDYASGPIVRCERLKLHLNGVDSGSKKLKEGYGGTYGEAWRSLRLAEFWTQSP